MCSKRKHFCLRMSKSAHDFFFIAVKYNIFIGQIFDHVCLVYKILGLAWLTLRKWPPILAKIVFSVSIFCQKTMCLVQNRIIHTSMIYIN